MSLVALLDCLSRYSQTAKLGRVLRASSGNFSTVPHMAQTAQTNTFAQELCPLDIACKHSPKPHAPAMHSIQHLVDNFSLVTGACQQGSHKEHNMDGGKRRLQAHTRWHLRVQGSDSQTSQCGTSEYQYHFLAYNLTRVSARIWYFLGNTHRCQPSWETERGPSILILMEVAGWILDTVGKPTCGKRFPPERVKVWREASERVVGFVLFCFDCSAKQVGRKWSTTPQGGLCRSAPWYDTVQRVWKCGNVLFPHSLHYHLTGLTCKDISEMSEFGRKPLQISCYQYLQPIPRVGCWMLGGKRSEIASPPAHPYIAKMDFSKEKTPLKIDEDLWIGGYECKLRGFIKWSYYAIGRRSEPTSSGDLGWYAMDDSQIKAAGTGNSPERFWMTMPALQKRLRQHLLDSCCCCCCWSKRTAAALTFLLPFHK